jgi:hypothetical protein
MSNGVDIAIRCDLGLASLEIVWVWDPGEPTWAEEEPTIAQRYGTGGVVDKLFGWKFYTRLAGTLRKEWKQSANSLGGFVSSLVRGRLGSNPTRLG